jgi:hypothetical protein
MRKLIWCCSAAGVLAAGGFLSLTYYACRYPQSLVGRSMQTIAEASISLQPLSGLSSLALRTQQANDLSQTPGAAEECVPDDPQPIAAEPASQPEAMIARNETTKDAEEAAPIVIHEDDPMPRENAVQAPPSTIDFAGLNGQELPANAAPLVMPYCQDDGEATVTPPVMPYADADDAKPARAVAKKKAGGAGEESEDDAFKAWKGLLKPTSDRNFNEKYYKRAWDLDPHSDPAEELPYPAEEEEPQAEPKCQEDSHRHEHYSGCPRVTCPYTGKSYPATLPAKKRGQEESSEEPPTSSNKSSHGKSGKNETPRTQGVDTMEYRPSDAGLNEYGPGPIQ